MRRTTVCDVAFFLALLSTAAALGAALAHALELPNKIGLGQVDYFIVQQIYRGWDLLGILLLVELVSMIGAAVCSRGRRKTFWLVVAAIVFLLAAQADFWIFPFPANAATNNWTVIPENWQQLRLRWEYSHLAGAVCQLLAMSSLILATLNRTRS